jgi:anti-sigma regulatory factor (Ser/Thr protein kinase)
MDRAQHKLEFTVESTPKASLQARAALASLLEVLAGETYADLRLVVNELVTNSVEHGPPGPISVSIELLPEGGVCGRVRDGGAGGVEISEGQEPGTGLGLLIVDTLAAAWGASPGSSDVWFEIAAPDGSRARDAAPWRPVIASAGREPDPSRRTACQ